MLSFGDGSQLNSCRSCFHIVLFMWLPGSSPFIPENEWTALLSLQCLPSRCMPACARGCAAAAAAAAAQRGVLGRAGFGEAPLAWRSRSALPSSPPAQRSQPACGNVLLLVPQKIPAGSRKKEGASSGVSLSTSHSFSPLTQRWVSSDTTARQKNQFNITPEILPLAPTSACVQLAENQLYVCAPL